MNSFSRRLGTLRLLPLVTVMAVVLLILKSIGLVTQGSYTLSGVEMALAQQQPATPTDEQAVTPAGEAATETPAAFQDAVVQTDNGVALEGVETSEDRLLERLGERRQLLDQREQDIAMREQLLAATEKRLEGRLAELEALQERIGAVSDEQRKAREAEVGRLITMYEAMKPKDAARIFNSLDMTILVEVARRINPRKMADILGKMESESAQRLTIALAGMTSMLTEQNPASERSLPQIEGTPTLLPQGN